VKRSFVKGICGEKGLSVHPAIIFRTPEEFIDFFWKLMYPVF